ncbi:hypothetical protein K431DRAFT_337691 [Polychaeton citri CBS 116435]|uniref:Proteasome subunit beta type protein n=1 Tax=Polychaeton citri CBS 116435 TaxID=1314669 RepID=A0A9P4QE33_9PEZI|nr:hypothetical protein K431DRAFT_337691 [Polychaeton citri CBS 116435]
MSSNNFNIKDLVPLPDNTEAITDPEKKDESQALGAAQEDHDLETKNLGWNKGSDQLPNPLVGGIDNEELWALIRRFNKQMYHVRDFPHPVANNLDLNIADEEEFSPDKLRSNIERLYMTVIIGLMGFGKHMVRLRSWREKRRTACFCAAYSIAWLFDFLVPLFAITLIVLITYPPSRAIMFPPAPLALVSAKTGGLQKPKAGVLGSHDSATGASENYKGEAVEAEASNFVNSIASVALSSASGKHPQGEPPGSDDEKEGTISSSVPDPTALAVGASNARTSAAGGNASAKIDKTKVPMETAMWNKMRPIMHGIADVSDTWERFANALSPTPPFNKDVYRLRLAAVVVPLLGISMFVTSYMYMKGVTFGVGFGFFGDPAIQPAIEFLNSRFPNWQKLLELRNTLLVGVPTNAQLTITLLRIGEANKSPLPPAPYVDAPPPEKPAELTEEHLQAAGADYPLNASEQEIRDAMAHDSSVPHQKAGTDTAAAQAKSHGKKGAKVMGLFKAGIKGTIETALGADHLKAKAGSGHSRDRLGVIPRNPTNKLSGPVDFVCRFHGKRGHAYISTVSTIPCVSFSLDKITDKKSDMLKEENQLHPVWSVAVADMKELKKVGGLGWKAKLVVGWALDREVADGLQIVDKLGNTWHLTAMVLRDELFNRLIALGGQKWEAL